MTSQLVIFRAFLFIFCIPPSTLDLKKNSRKPTNKKKSGLSTKISLAGSSTDIWLLSLGLIQKYTHMAPRRENLSSRLANNKGPDQPAHPHPCSLISAFVIHLRPLDLQSDLHLLPDNLPTVLCSPVLFIYWKVSYLKNATSEIAIF